MKRILSALVTVLAASLFLAAHADSPAGDAPLVFRDVTVVDATGAPPAPHRSVVLRAGTIAAIEPNDSARIPAGARVVDARGWYMIPGLWDMHAHAFGEARAHLLPLYYFQLSLANGVTGLRDMAGFADSIEADEQWRTALRVGTVLGPDLLMAGALVDGPNPTYPRSINVADAQQGRDAVLSLQKRGVDFIKVYNMLPRDAFFGIAEEAKKLNLPFAGHVPLALRASEASDAGQASFEHLWGLLLECSSREAELRRKMLAEANRPGTRPSQLRPHTLFARELAASYDPQKAADLFRLLKKNGTWQVPTLAVLHMLGYIEEIRKTEDPRLRYFPRALVEEWNPAADWRLNQRNADEIERSHILFDQDVRLVRAMHAAGLRFLAGTDSTEPYTFPGFTLHDELAWLVAAGLSPMEALQSATRNPAEFLRRLDRQGTVEVGKDADLVLLRANPLTDIHNTTKIAGVVLRGRYLDRAELDSLLAGVAAASAAN